jgi:hypothetical protein
MFISQVFFFFQESIFQQASPIKRRESTPLLEKIKTDVSIVKQKLTNWKKPEKPKEKKEDSPMVKYIISQVTHFYFIMSLLFLWL